MIEQNIFDNSNATSNSEQIKVLKKYFPNCFDKDGRFLIDSFKDIFKSNNIETSHEGYKLDWLGKSYARLLANEKPHTLIRPDKEHNAKEQNKNSNNLLIKGDNLEVLKHLKNAYTESVKVIYIDPPYNTGSDGFVYKDDRRFTKEELSNIANVSEEEAQRILDFTDRGSNSHSAWLTFIYPRLYVARELLREDGVIFISIDDNEQAQLKLLCDEVFGEENFVATLVWNLGTGTQAGHFVRSHEFILVYFKIKNSAPNFKGGEGIIEHSALKKISSKNPASDFTFPAGTRFEAENDFELTGSWGGSEKTTLVKGRMVAENGLLKENVTLNAGWSQKKQMKNWFSGLETIDSKGQKVIEFYFNKNGVLRYRKDRSVINPPTVIRDIANTKKGGLLIESIFGCSIFEYPKPIELLSFILSLVIEKDSIVLDFFGGSCTTAHSVMQLNAKNKYNNSKYIMVQLPETINSKTESGRNAIKYCIDNNLDQTIFSIAKARLEKAAQIILIENPDYKGDLGFKIFETIPLPEYYDEEVDKLSTDTQLKIWDGSDINEDQLEAILTTWTLYDRILLTTSLESIMFGGYKAYYGIGKESNTLYLMYKGFNIDHIKLIIDKLENDKDFTPKKIVIYGHNFETKPQRELSEALNSFRNKKQLDIDIVKRY